jgi:hypothetical protein
MTPFNKFWTERVERQNREKQVRLQAAQTFNTDFPDDEKWALPAHMPAEERRELVQRYIGDGKASEASLLPVFHAEQSNSNAAAAAASRPAVQPSQSHPHTPTGSAPSGSATRHASQHEHDRSVAGVPTKPKTANATSSQRPTSCRLDSNPESMSAVAKVFSMKQRELIERLSRNQ